MQIADEVISTDMRRLIWELEDWTQWNRRQSSAILRKLGFRGRSAVFSTGYNASKSFEEVFSSSSRMYTLDQMINDLPPAYGQAIHKRYLREVYRFPRNNYAQMLAEAHVALLEAAYAKGFLIKG